MKGFIKILEAIIASVIILTALTFFFNTRLPESNWGDALLKVRTDDALAALVKAGVVQQAVANTDPGVINNVLLDPELNIMPITLGYSVQVNGIPNPVIYIGCNCTQADMNTLQNLLAPHSFTYKGRNIELRFEFEGIDSIRNETNILAVFGYTDLNQSAQKLSRFMERDGTIMIIGDLTQAQVNDGYINNTFGLKWVSGSRTNSGSFYNSADEELTSFRVAKYYSEITGASDNFGFSGSATIEVDYRTVVADENTAFSLVKINRDVAKGHGRTVWMATPDNDQQTRDMLKASVMWASGETFRLDTSAKTPAPNRFQSSAIVYDSDPYEVVLTVWKVFQ
jgi:hypothetical protein